MSPRFQQHQNRFNDDSQAQRQSPSTFEIAGRSQTTQNLLNIPGQHNKEASNNSNPQAAKIDPLFDYRRMNDPETYYVPAPQKERGDLEAADAAAMERLKAAFECAIC